MTAENPLKPMLLKLESRVPLSEADRTAVLALPNNIRRIEAARYIIREGDRAENCCLLRSGFIYRHKIVGDGSRQILALHVPGDLVDLQNSPLETADHSIQAMTEVEIALIPRQAILALAAKHPEIARAMWLDTLVDASVFREWIANVGRRDARCRMAHVLCEFAMRQEMAGLGERTHYEMPMTQEQLADVLGLTPVHVNRTLKSLEADGLISRDKRSYAISDWDKLREAGDFNAAYLHLNLRHGA